MVHHNSRPSPPQSRVDSRNNFRASSERTTSGAAAVIKILGPPVPEQTAWRTAAPETGSRVLEAGVPMQNGFTVAVHGSAGHPHMPPATTRCLVATAPPFPAESEKSGKRIRAGHQSFSSTRKRPSLARGRTAPTGHGHYSGSIPSKSRRVADNDVEPVLTSRLSARSRGADAGPALQRDNAFVGNITVGMGVWGGKGRGTQAGCTRPLVPRPSSSRPLGECRPW